MLSFWQMCCTDSLTRCSLLFSVHLHVLGDSLTEAYFNFTEGTLNKTEVLMTLNIE